MAHSPPMGIATFDRGCAFGSSLTTIRLNRHRETQGTAGAGEVVSAKPGEAEIAMPWRQYVGQYAGFLHAELVGALIDTACGFAAATMVGRVLASHHSVNCLRPAVGERFVARARVVKQVQSMVFTACELCASSMVREWKNCCRCWTPCVS